MKQLSLEEKKDIQARLQVYVSKYPSQNKAVNSLGISAGTISTILNGKFDNISDEIVPADPLANFSCESGGMDCLRNDGLPGIISFAGGCASESKRVMGGRKCRYRQDDDRARLCCQA